ncbi:hypothetical protein OG723_44445 (plasmid) [Streptomyces sp. NBC_01278]|uniref:hypothetical protein n=1 Tax=Streptomyces sp. NBC_01278 TaxID=2903809 RepID=UPI002E34B840|nr:hypothetical protein [Streptomyces sp. NBC_01278]
MHSPLLRPNGSPADWPEFPAVTPLRTDTPLPAEQWPALALSWQMVTPHVLNPDQGDVIDAWLTQPGAPGPVAVAYRHRWNRSHPHGWHCGVHVFSVQPAGAAHTRCRMSYDCTTWGIERTPEEARDGALRHISDEHQDVAVPYPARALRAQRFYG